MTRRPRWISVFTLLFCLGAAAPATAQQFDLAPLAADAADPIPKEFRDQFKKQMDQAAAQQRKSLQTRMRVEIDEIRRACELSDQQTKRLEIASKGAIDRTMQQWTKQMAQMQMQMMGNIGFEIDPFAGLGDVEVILEAAEDAAAGDAADGGPGADIPVPDEPARPPTTELAEPDPVADVADDAAIQADVEIAVPPPANNVGRVLFANLFQAAENVARGFVGKPARIQDAAFEEQWIGPAIHMGDWGFHGPPVADVTAQRIWTTTVDKVLTAEQKHRLAQIRHERLEFKRAAVLRAMVARIDTQILLTPQQREQILQVMEDSMKPDAGHRVEFMIVDGITVPNLQSISESRLKPILSQAQLARWSEVAIEDHHVHGGWIVEEAMFEMEDVEDVADIEFADEAIDDDDN